MISGFASWRGRAALLVGNGPAMRGFDWARLRGCRWLGMNRACVHAPPILLVGDDGDDLRALAQTPGWRACGARVHHRHPDQRSFHDLDPGILEVARLPGWSRNISAGLGYGNSSAYAALNLLDLIGADPIYLLGIEMLPTPEYAAPSWYGAPAPTGGHALAHAAADLNERAQPRAEVYQLTWPSAVTRWPRANLEEALRAARA